MLNYKLKKKKFISYVLLVFGYILHLCLVLLYCIHCVYTTHSNIFGWHLNTRTNIREIQKLKCLVCVFLEGKNKTKLSDQKKNGNKNKIKYRKKTEKNGDASIFFYCSFFFKLSAAIVSGIFCMSSSTTTINTFFSMILSLAHKYR